jgi:Tol biopolymer transport system component/DNA-binding winged helix-turn-helix (wHTH) protein
LKKHGIRIGLERQPAEILELLLGRPGEVVTREEIRTRLWPGDTMVDTDDAISTAVRKIRTALADSAAKPRYVETLPKRGYRFIGAVESTAAPAPVLAAVPVPVEAPGGVNRPRRRGALAAGLTLLAAGLAVWTWLSRPYPAPHADRYTQLTHDGVPKFGSLVTDGVRLYFGVDAMLVQLSTTGGATVPVSGGWNLMALSPAGDQLLASKQEPGTVAELPLFILRLPAAQPFRLGLTGHAAAWSPDGERIVYGKGDSLYTAGKDGSGSRLLAKFPASVDSPAWSPDGATIRCTLTAADGGAIWEVPAAGGAPHRSFGPAAAGLHGSGGQWTPDGRYFVFPERTTGQLWAVREQLSRWLHPRQGLFPLTSGPVRFHQIAPGRNGRTLFAIGGLERGELMRYDAAEGRFVSYLNGLGGDQLAFSPDGSRMVWVRLADETLWQGRASGTEAAPLTTPGAAAAMPRWSPDGKTIAFAGRGGSGPMRIYLVAAEGGAPRELAAAGEGANPNWSPDGQALVFGGAPWLHDFRPGSTAIRILDLRSGSVSVLPGSEGLWAPKWSPDGTVIAAQTLDSRGLKLYHVASRRWEDLGVAESVIGYPCWSRDSRYLYFNTSGAENRGAAIWRIGRAERRMELVTPLRDVRLGGSLWQWFGLTPDGSMLILRTSSAYDVYGIDVELP